MSALVAIGLALAAGVYAAWAWRDVEAGDLPHELEREQLVELAEAEAALQRQWSAAAGELESSREGEEG